MTQEALRLIRIFHDYNLSVLAEKLDISVSYLSEIESGKKKPTVDLINRYAKVFNVSPSAIMFFSEKISAKNSIKAGIRNKMLKFLEAIESNANA